MFIEGLLDGQTDAGEFPDRKKSSSGLRLEELLIYIYKKKVPLKGPSNLDRRYPSMPEPTGGLGGLPRPTYIIILTPVSEIQTFRSTHIISHAKVFYLQSY